MLDRDAAMAQQLSRWVYLWSMYVSGNLTKGKMSNCAQSRCPQSWGTLYPKMLWEIVNSRKPAKILQLKGSSKIKVCSYPACMQQLQRTESYVQNWSCRDSYVKWLHSYIRQNQRVSLYKEGKVSAEEDPRACFLNRPQPRLQDVDVALALPAMAFQLTIPSGQLVVISAPTVLRIVWPARVTVYLTDPVCPLKGTER